MKIIAFLFTAFISLQMSGQEKFPDGTPIPDWFRQNEIVNIDTLGKKYTITDYGVANDSTILHYRPHSIRLQTGLPQLLLPIKNHLIMASCKFSFSFYFQLGVCETPQAA